MDFFLSSEMMDIELKIEKKEHPYIVWLITKCMPSNINP